VAVKSQLCKYTDCKAYATCSTPELTPVICTLSSLFVLNAAALSKPHAVEHLAADLASYNIDVAVITETHFKVKHSDSIVNVDGYNIFRRDRSRRRGGGVALYVRSTLQASVWNYSADDQTYEIHWVRVCNNVFVAALYHPPKPIYKPSELLEYVEACVEEINSDFPSAYIVLAGDMNQLPDQELVEQTGLTQIVHQPTRGVNILDRIFVSDPNMFDTVRVVKSVVRSDHKAVVAFLDQGCQKSHQPKDVRQAVFRPKSPTQNAQFLQHIASMSFDSPRPTLSATSTIDAQSDFDSFYSTAIILLNHFYPQRSITITTRDPDFITPEIKAKLRRKNRLMRAGRVEEAGALAERIGRDMKKYGKTRFRKIGGKTDAKDMWEAVRKLTGKHHEAAVVDGITAESLNDHYASISNDLSYTPPLRKTTASASDIHYISEYSVFQRLDKLRHTATGLDGLPAWFLRLGAPVFCKPIARLFNLSLSTSTVPQQWKTASILPIPKVHPPKKHADFRPISITPVLTRVMERTIVHHFLYPAFLFPPLSLSFSDQFAFRPTGSPAAAIITLINHITASLLTNPYVIVISLDFSKAFDTVRHSTLLEKLAQLDIPDEAYNWLVDFFGGHSHSTVYRGQTSTLKSINASIIQGSGIGPASYVATAGDLRAATAGNRLVKFADDTYLIVPASNVDSRSTELNNVEAWAMKNNLALNRSKSKEVIFIDPRRKRQFVVPASLHGIDRESSVKVLGITITDNLSASDHVRSVISSSAQTLYALRVLRAHGMNDLALQVIFRSVVVAKLMYASSAWCGFVKEADRQRVDAFLIRSKRCGFCPPDLPSFGDLCNISDEQLFHKVINDSHHVLYDLLPPKTVASQNYHLRERTHNRQLPEHSGHLINSNFIIRMLYTDIY
jgi:Reverse transcriptase (RNA-dependent DNA polymerase)/Endonuclease/Exonuclease/phosphatase family